jgi:c-di-GMP-binding flagellar brake protein YcgR
MDEKISILTLRNILKRRDVRHPYPDIIEYVCTSKETEGPYKGITIDMSKSGACMYLFDRQKEGEDITIQNSYPIISQKAVIRWIRKLQENFYIAGLQFKQQKETNKCPVHVPD